MYSLIIFENKMGKSFLFQNSEDAQNLWRILSLYMKHKEKRQETLLKVPFWTFSNFYLIKSIQKKIFNNIHINYIFRKSFQYFI